MTCGSKHAVADTRILNRMCICTFSGKNGQSSTCMQTREVMDASSDAYMLVPGFNSVLTQRWYGKNCGKGTTMLELSSVLKKHHPSPAAVYLSIVHDDY